MENKLRIKVSPKEVATLQSLQISCDIIAGFAYFKHRYQYDAVNSKLKGKIK